MATIQILKCKSCSFALNKGDIKAGRCPKCTTPIIYKRSADETSENEFKNALEDKSNEELHEVLENIAYRRSVENEIDHLVATIDYALSIYTDDEKKICGQMPSFSYDIDCCNRHLENLHEKKEKLIAENTKAQSFIDQKNAEFVALSQAPATKFSVFGGGKKIQPDASLPLYQRGIEKNKSTLEKYEKMEITFLATKSLMQELKSKIDLNLSKIDEADEALATEIQFILAQRGYTQKLNSLSDK